MRDIERIPEILAKLEEIWKTDPDLRLGQLIMILARPSTPCPDVFYLEDDTLLERLASFGQRRSDGDDGRKRPAWERYPDLIRIPLEDLTLDLVLQFIRVAQEDDPQRIFSPRNMMEWVGAPVHDTYWLNQQKDRVEKLDQLLRELKVRKVLKVEVLGYRLNPESGLNEV
ncbi:MAG: hypothetical protein AAFU60_04755 [Bacteroidota bacterium]